MPPLSYEIDDGHRSLHRTMDIVVTVKAFMTGDLFSQGVLPVTIGNICTGVTTANAAAQL